MKFYTREHALSSVLTICLDLYIYCSIRYEQTSSIVHEHIINNGISKYIKCSSYYEQCYSTLKFTILLIYNNKSARAFDE